MAITNAQQYQQLVKKRADGERPGYYGSDAGFGDDNYKDNQASFERESQARVDAGGSGGGTEAQFRAARKTLGTATQEAKIAENKRKKEQEQIKKINKQIDLKKKKNKKTKTLEILKDQFEDDNNDVQFSIFDTNEDGKVGPLEKLDELRTNIAKKTLTNSAAQDLGMMPKTLLPSVFMSDMLRKTPPGVTTKGLDEILGVEGRRDPETGIVANRLEGVSSFTNPFEVDYSMGQYGLKGTDLTRARDKIDVAMQDKITQKDFESVYGNKPPEIIGGEGNQDPCKGPNPPAYCFVGIRSAEAATPEVVEEDEIINYRLMADGGRAALAEGGMPYEGGIMDLESSRQMYGLGKLVKKITRGVKKIAKSPIGKAALLYAGGTYLGGLNAFGGSGTFMANLKSGQGIGNLINFGKNKLFGELITGGNAAKGAGYYKKGLLSNKALMGIGIPTALSYFMTPEEEEEQKLANYGADIDDPRFIMANASKYINPRLMAEGGSTEEKEPVAKKTMPLLDMDGQEMDLRDEGGFVPLGRMERADDVPARLSKNEFVFTADAVRNAGEGDVDKGAEVMYNMMKNLESGGDVSEESQGLEGAREMFQTSQRLEEVI